MSNYPCDPCDCPEAYYRDSQSWRKAMIELLCEIESAITTITGENIWDRAGTIISQHHAGDDVDLGAGDLSATALTLAGSATFTTTTSAIIFGTGVDQLESYTIRGASVDGKDKTLLSITPASVADVSRGAMIKLHGNEETGTGRLEMRCGDVGNSYLELNAANTYVYIDRSTTAAGTGMSLNNASTANTTFTIHSSRADGSDDMTLNICAGGALGTTRGASITLKGDDVGGAAAGGGIIHEPGTGTTAYHVFKSVPVFANNAAAVGGGVPVGGLYRNNADPDVVMIVH